MGLPNLLTIFYFCVKNFSHPATPFDQLDSYMGVHACCDLLHICPWPGSCGGLPGGVRAADDRTIPADATVEAGAVCPALGTTATWAPVRTLDNTVLL